MSAQKLGYLILLFTLAAAPLWSQTQLPEGNGRETVQTACTICHSLDRVFNANFDAKDWDNVVDMMVNNGVPVRKLKLPPLRNI